MSISYKANLQDTEPDYQNKPREAYDIVNNNLYNNEIGPHKRRYLNQPGEQLKTPER